MIAGSITKVINFELIEKANGEYELWSSVQTNFGSLPANNWIAEGSYEDMIALKTKLEKL